MTQQVYIVTGAPEEALEAILDAISSAGGGIVGHYTHCAFTNAGVGRFKPDSSANPHLGAVGEINAVDEWRIETFCDLDKAKAVVQGIRAAHPYEEPVVYVMPLMNIDDLP